MNVEVVVNGHDRCQSPLRCTELTDGRWHRKVKGDDAQDSIEFIRARNDGTVDCITFGRHMRTWKPVELSLHLRFDPNPVSLTITYPAS